MKFLNQERLTPKTNKMKEVVLITGANGHLAKVTGKYLSKYYDVRYLTTKKKSSIKESYFEWNIEKEYIDTKALENCTHIVHLSGYSILKKWTKKNKRIIYDSRIKTAGLILETCKKLNIKPKTFISASAIGIYAKSAKEDMHEESSKGNDWVAKMACDWEDAANRFKELGSRVVQMRISLIFSENAGFLKYNLLSMKYGLGLITGNSKRKINWMHVSDIASFIKQSICNEAYHGPYNLASDDKISQENFIQAIRKKLFPYSVVIKIPMFLVSFFLGKRSQIIDANISLETKKIKENGFKCKFNTLNKMIDNLKIDL